MKDFEVRSGWSCWQGAPGSDLEGETFPEELDEAGFNEDVKEGVYVLVYTKTKYGRPWIGRVLRKLVGSVFTFQWFDRRQGNTSKPCLVPRAGVGQT
jgi:hypothetical protein